MPFRLWVAINAALLIILLAVSLIVGAQPIPVMDVIDALTGASSESDPIGFAIVRDIRLPRTILAILVGAGLGMAGAAYQGLFRNPIADPFVVGASSGAAVGVAFAIYFGWQAISTTLSAMPVAAFLGSLTAVGIVYLCSAWGSRTSAVALLLAGAAVSSFLTAIVWLLMFLDEKMAVLINWLMGGLGSGGWPELSHAAPCLCVGMAVIWSLSRPLDALSCGEEAAESLGMRLMPMSALIVAAATLTTAASVAAAGVIGFVGLVAPHVTRLMIGASHAKVLPGSALAGACLLLAADALARSAKPPIVIPVGILTSLLGGPFFLYLLRQRVVRN